MLKMTELNTEEQLRDLLKILFDSKAPLTNRSDSYELKYKNVPEYETLIEWTAYSPEVKVVEDRVLIPLGSDYIQIQRPVHDINLRNFLDSNGSRKARALIDKNLGYRS